MYCGRIIRVFLWNIARITQLYLTYVLKRIVRILDTTSRVALCIFIGANGVYCAHISTTLHPFGSWDSHIIRILNAYCIVFLGGFQAAET